LTGYTLSADFPTMNPVQLAIGSVGSSDAFVTKFDPNGSIVYSTYLGGNGPDTSTGITVDSSGNIYIAGSTGSTNFPLVNPIQAVYGGAITDWFVAKLNAAGSTLLFSTYLGG